MIVGLTGSICSGKETMARYLVEKHGFQAVNILDLFREHISKMQTSGGTGKQQGNDNTHNFDPLSSSLLKNVSSSVKEI